MDWSQGFGRKILSGLTREQRTALAEEIESGMLDCRMAHLGAALRAAGIEPRSIYERFGVARQAFDKWFPGWGQPAKDPYPQVRINSKKLALFEIWYRPQYLKSRDEKRELDWGSICGADYVRTVVLPTKDRREIVARPSNDRRLIASLPQTAKLTLSLSEFREILKLPPPSLDGFDGVCRALHSASSSPHWEPFPAFTKRMEVLSHQWGLAVEVTCLFLGDGIHIRGPYAPTPAPSSPARKRPPDKQVSS